MNSIFFKCSTLFNLIWNEMFVFAIQFQIIFQMNFIKFYEICSDEKITQLWFILEWILNI